jgi:S-adenosylmethionine-diacylglycerol 3-amino-3-carboxypropyl transferase
VNNLNVLPDWVEEAKKTPIYFSQVREDSLIDLQIARLLGKDLKVIMIASGGCTAATLAGSGIISVLHMVDMNASQLALTNLKLKLLSKACRKERLFVLGYARDDLHSTEYSLNTWLAEAGLEHKLFGDEQTVNLLGLDFCGRYEQLFAQLQKELSPYREGLEKLLALSEPLKQISLISDGTVLGNALKKAFNRIMELPNLKALFGEAAVQNRHTSFAEHFFERTQNILSTQPASTNPYLHCVLSGKRVNKILCPWIEIPASDRMPSLSFFQGDMLSVLSESRYKYDIIHLSNICDWLEREEARNLLVECYSRLNPGGMVLIRQLNSTLNIPSLLTKFDWQTKLSEELLSKDRSFFYRSIHVGVKR